MKNIYDWLDAYGESHQNPTNKKIHWVCVPLIMLTLLGLLSLIKIPLSIANMPINLSHILLVVALLFYLRLSVSISFGMIIISFITLFIINRLEIIFPDINQLLYLYISIFVLSWIGQFIGHKIEGKKPSFFEDIQFLLIGPAWLLSFIYNKMGIKY
tara:strand:- start:1108 stop:1578 length:471 start_codon:yes stop_codon:yes gene_type:complete